MQRGERPVPVVFFSNAYGVRVWSTQHPPKIADAETDEHLADGTWKAGGSIKAGGGLGSALERSGRVLEIGPLEEGNPEFSLKESSAQTDPAGLRVVLSNDDDALGFLEAEENVLSAQVRLALIQPGSADWNDHLVLGDFRVVEYILERERLTLDCREV